MRKFITIWFLIFFFSSARTSLAADILVNEEQIINPSASWNQNYSSITCSSAEDKCLVVWRDKRNDDTDKNDGGESRPNLSDPLKNADIYGRFVNSSGTIGNDVVIATDNISATRKVDQAYPQVAYNPNNNEFMVVWQEVRPEATETHYTRFCLQGGYDIFGQRISASGTLIGGKISVSVENDCQWVPRIAFDNFKKVYLVTWHDHRDRTTVNQKEIYGQFIDAAGNLLSENFVLTKDGQTGENAARYQEYSAVVFNKDKKEFFAVWTDDRESINTFAQDIWGQRLIWENDRVNFIGTNFPVFKGTGKSSAPEVDYNPALQRYLVVWDEWGSDSVSSQKKAKAAWVSAEGAVIEIFDIGSEDISPGFPSIAFDLNGLGIFSHEIGSGSANGRTEVKLLQGNQFLASKNFIGWAWMRPTVVFNPTANKFMVAYLKYASGFDRLAFRSIEITGMPVPTVTITPTPTVTITPTPPIGSCSCPTDRPLKSNGNANCDTIVDLRDFFVWRNEFLGSGSKIADFNCDGKVNLPDFFIWRRGFLEQ